MKGQEYPFVVLSFILQSRNKKCYTSVTSDFFSNSLHRRLFELGKKYIQVYGSVPSFHTFRIYVSEQDTGLVSLYDQCINYTLGGDYAFTREYVAREGKRNIVKQLLREYAPKIDTLDVSHFEQIVKQAALLEEDLEAAETETEELPKLAFQEFEGFHRLNVDAASTPWEGWNSMMTNRGFVSPELIVVASEPKAFKTGVLINLAWHFVKCGLSVLYVDAENGADNINIRLYQTILHASRDEIVSGIYSENLGKVASYLSRACRGKIAIKQYRPQIDTLRDVRRDLHIMYKEKDFHPDVIIYDHLDLLAPVNRSDQKRLNIQDNYLQAVSLNVELGSFCITASHINRTGTQASRVSIAHLSEDHAKSGNAHGVFNIAATEAEKRASVLRLVPIVQRSGLDAFRAATCYFKVIPEYMFLKEITEADAEHECIQAANAEEREVFPPSTAAESTTEDKNDEIENPTVVPF